MNRGAATDVRAAVDELTAWGVDRLRDLPWRRTRDPWAVLVAEIMLQQTQVHRVVDPYDAFLARFPTPADCARRPVSDVLRAWEGLGYNRRAVYLHRAAVHIVDVHGGKVPDELEALMALPGIGPYTARAVLVFAYEHDVAVVDTNVGRVLARAFAGRQLNPRDAQALADALVPPDCGWQWNQTMLDFGAQICTKRAPQCAICPIAAHCAWGESGFQQPDPATASAGVAMPQSKFDGSDRQGRGRLVAALRRGPVAIDDVAKHAGWPDEPERAAHIARGLVADGLATSTGDWLTLPGGAGGETT